MKLRIDNVDLYGYNGRDHHPTRRDIGLTVTVQKAWVEGENEIDTDGTPLAYTVFECRAEDGRTLQLVDHEVEFVSMLNF